MQRPKPANRASRDGRAVYWPVVLAMLPFIYIFTVVAPGPFGSGLHFANDFEAHRIWYTQVDTYFISKGYFPLWNPTFEMGSPHLAMNFGVGALYPIRWLSYVFTYFGGTLSYIAQYVQVAGHMSFALLGLFLTLRRHGGLSAPASALGASVLLLNQGFNNFIRFPYGVENLAWVPWVLYFSLNIARRPPDAGNAHVRSTRRDFVAIALCVACGGLTGYGQFSYVGGLFVGLVVLCSARSFRSVGIVALAGLLGSLVAIGAIWPAAEWVMHHPLRDGSDIANIHVIGVTDYANIFLRPFAVDVHYSGYTFPALIVLALGGLAVAWRRDTARLSLGMLIGALWFIDTARGLDGLSFRFLYDHLPLFGAFNSPSKVIWLAFMPIAWFMGFFLDAALARRRLAAAVVAFLGIMSLLLAWQYAPVVPESSVGIWQPLKVGWLTAGHSVGAYITLVFASSLAVGCFLFFRSRVLQAACLPFLGVVFAACFARYNTFVGETPNPQSRLATGDAYPAGLLARRDAKQGYLGLGGIGLTSPNVDPVVYHLMLNKGDELVGNEQARFPATRFLWRPQTGAEPSTLKLLSFGPNHIKFDVEAQSDGELVFLKKYSDHWESNIPFTRDPIYDEFLRFEVPTGGTSFRLEFTPVSHIVTCIVSFLSVFALAGLLARMHGRKRTAALCYAAAVILPVLMLLGSLTRHSMSDRDLFGIDGISLDLEWRVPASKAGRPGPQES
ncbi:MAG: hypothetical protein O7D94_05275 [Planctomycetota bacterium]|nr:hypothetical protein [Planctomycetota bacterium]